MPLNYSPAASQLRSVTWPPVVICSTTASKLPPDLVVWAPVASAIAVLIVGGLAASIAWRQWRTAHTKVQLDLYALRLPTYTAVRDFMTACTIGSVELLHLSQLKSTQEEAAFIFNDRIANFIDQLWREGWLAWETENGIWDDVNQVSMPPAPMEAEIMWEKLRQRRAEAFALFAPFLRLEDRNNVAWVSILQNAKRSISAVTDFVIRLVTV